MSFCEDTDGWQKLIFLVLTSELWLVNVFDLCLSNSSLMEDYRSYLGITRADIQEEQALNMD